MTTTPLKTMDDHGYVRFQPIGSSDGSVIFGCEFSANCLSELKDLHQQQWDEIEVNYLGVEMAPDYVYLDSAEVRKRAVLFTVRDADTGVMVGNALFLVGPSLHVMGETVANEDVFFLVKDYRGRQLSIDFMAYMKACLSTFGVDRMTMTDKSPVGGKALERFFMATGFTRVASLYITKLDGE